MLLLKIGEVTVFTGKVDGVDSDKLVFTVNNVETDRVNVAAGTYNVTATFLGNDTHNSGSAVRAFTIEKQNVTVTIDDVDLVINTRVTFTAKVDGHESSDVVIYVNGAQGATVDVVSGSYTVTATFIGNATHNTGSATKVFNVDKVQAVIQSVGAEPVYIGSESVIIVKMNNTESGFIVLEIDGKNVTANIVNKTANYTVALSLGVHNVTAYFIGNTEYSAAIPVSAKVTVNERETSIITINDVDLVVGEDATITAKLNGVDDDNLTVLINGVETNRISPVEDIPYTVTVKFGGNKIHQPAEVTQTYHADKIATTISVSAITPIITEHTTIITVSPSVNTGNVIVNVNGTKYIIDVSQTKQLNLTLTKIGTYTVNATYQANGKYLESVSSNIEVVVDKDKPTVSILADKSGNIDVIVSGRSTGNVTLSINGKEIGTKTLDSDGKTRFNVEFGAGEQTITAAYSGDGEHYSSTNSSTYKFYNSTTYIGGSDMTVYYGYGGTYTVKLFDSKGAIAGKKLTFVLNNVYYNRTTDANGEATISIDLAIGSHVVTVSFTADDEYPSASTTNNINVLSSISATDMKRGHYSDYDYQATFFNSAGGRLANSNVQFIVNGVTYDVVTDANGVANLHADLSVGTYSVTIVSPSGEELQRTATIVQRIQENSDLNMYYDDGSSFTVRVYGDDGNIAVGQTVLFRVNGITYTENSNANGYASLKINLAHKSYTMSVDFKGENAKNKIVVKNIIIAKKTTNVKTTAKSLKIKITLKGKKSLQS